MPAKSARKDNPKFLSVPQLTALLNHADPSLVPYLSICAFAGLRSAEAKSLSWRHIDLKRNLITVSENISKTGEERKIPIQPNLSAWLAPQAQLTGFILPREHSQRIDDLLKAAKLAPAYRLGLLSFKTPCGNPFALTTTRCSAPQTAPPNMPAMIFGR